MKKLEDFKAEKIEINSIYGGKQAANTFNCNTITVGGECDGQDDGSDEHLDV